MDNICNELDGIANQTPKPCLALWQLCCNECLIELRPCLIRSVKAPPMVGPTWTRVCISLRSDCLPVLSQRTVSLLPRVFWSAYCSHAHDSMIWMIQGCISTSHSVMSPWGLLFTPYSICVHGTLYPMTDYCTYNWWRVSTPASADALQASLQFYY